MQKEMSASPYELDMRFVKFFEITSIAFLNLFGGRNEGQTPEEALRTLVNNSKGSLPERRRRLEEVRKRKSESETRAAEVAIEDAEKLADFLEESLNRLPKQVPSWTLCAYVATAYGCQTRAVERELDKLN